MRRKDREMGKDFGIKVIDKSKYGVVSIVEENKEPYGIPLSIVRDGDTLYFHSAMDGKKVKIFTGSPIVSIAFIGETNIPENYTEEEKIKAMKLICEKHTSSKMKYFHMAIKAGLKRTNVYKVEIDEITSKRKKYDIDGKEMKWERME